MGMGYRLLKFRCINKYLLNSIVSNSLYFPSPSELNDPFDCQFDLKKCLLKAAEEVEIERNKDLLREISNSRIAETIKYLIENTGIYCCSEKSGEINKDTLCHTLIVIMNLIFPQKHDLKVVQKHK